MELNLADHTGRRKGHMWATAPIGGPPLDAAHFFRLALERGEAGARDQAVAGEAVPVDDIAGILGRRSDIPMVSKCPRRRPSISVGSRALPRR
jgi:hypothetical protein